MKCPRCQSSVTFRDMSFERCPVCDTKIYFSSDGRWLRGVICGAFAILLTYHWCPLQHPGAEFSAYVLWLAGTLALYLLLLVNSVYVFPPLIELLPEGSIRIDLDTHSK